MAGKRKEGKVLIGRYVPVELKRALERMTEERGQTVSALLNEMTEDFVSQFLDDKKETSKLSAKVT